jgi:hypothetical protein
MTQQDAPVSIIAQTATGVAAVPPAARIAAAAVVVTAR